MKERTVIVVMHPRDQIWDALCERTCDLARYLDEIESAELKSRETTPEGLIRCVHFWRARVNVPPFLAPHIVDTGFLEWTARTEWLPADYKSRWIIEPQFMKASTLCNVNMSFSPAIGGKGTRLDLQLEVQDAQSLAGLHVITKSVVNNLFQKLVEATTRLIEDKASPG